MGTSGSCATRRAEVTASARTLPARSVKDLIAFARQRPGELGYASSGVGSVAHLSGASLAIRSFTLRAGSDGCT